MIFTNLVNNTNYKYRKHTELYQQHWLHRLHENTDYINHTYLTNHTNYTDW